MIAAGSADRATKSAERLRSVLAEAGIVSPGLGVEPYVWEMPHQGPVRVVKLGQVLPEVADQIAGLLDTGIRARKAPLRQRLREVNDRTRARGAL